MTKLLETEAEDEKATSKIREEDPITVPAVSKWNLAGATPRCKEKQVLISLDPRGWVIGLLAPRLLMKGDDRARARKKYLCRI
jgi:hypothetical protein